MAIVSYGLTTVARVKTFLGIGNAINDTLLERLINQCSDFIEKFCDRRFLKTTYTNEVYDGNGQNRMVLKQYPVVSGETFTLQSRDSYNNQSSFTTVSSESYFITESEGIIIYMGGTGLDAPVFNKIPQHYRVTYTAGYDFDNVTPGSTLEDAGIGDLEYAVWKLVAKAFNNRKISSNVQSEKLGDYSVSFRKEAMSDTEIEEILNKYKRPYEH